MTYKKTILSNLSWITLQDIPSQLLGILFFTLLGRYLGQYGIGSYSYVFSVLAIVNLVLDFGLNNYFWRRWSSDSSLIKADEPLYITSKFMALCIAIIPFLIYIVLFDYGLWSFFLLAAVYTILDVPRSLPLISFQSKNDYKSAFFTNMTDRVLAFGGGISLILLGYSLHAVLVAFIIARLASLAVGFYLYGHLPRITFTWKSAFRLLIDNKLIFLITIFSYLYFKVDVVVMRRILGIDAVGLYSSAYRVLDSLAMIPNLVLFAIFPSLAHMAHHQDDTSTRVVTEKAIKYLLSLALFIALVTQFYPKEILSFLYKNAFLPAAPTLSVLGWTGVLMASTVPLVYMHLAQKNDIVLLKRLVFLTCINVGLNIVLLPLIGIIGAAYATLVTEAVSAYILIKHAHVKIGLTWLPKLLLITAITGGLYMMIHPPLFFMSGITFGLYVFALWATKVIDLNDIHGKK